MTRASQLLCGFKKSTSNQPREDTLPACKTILFVDDEPSILKVRQLIFESMGYCALTAESGEEALDVLREKAVDVVVLDYLMPGMDGEETALEIRRLLGDIPIILSSGCLSIPERVLEIVSASVDKIDGPEALVMAVEQQLRLVPVALENSRKHAAVQLESR